MLKAIAGGGGSGGITIGQSVTGGTPSSLIYEDASGNLAASANIPFQVTNQGLTTTNPGWLIQVTGDANPRGALQLNASDVPRLAFGPGTGGLDTFFSRRASRQFVFGGIDAASALAQTLTVQNVIAGTTDTAGADFTIDGSRSTGTGVAGNIVFQTAGSAAGTGSTQNALATVMTIGPSTLRAAQTTPVLSLAQTWNDAGTTFTGLRLNITNSASAAASLLMDLQVGGVSQVKISEGGGITALGGLTVAGQGDVGFTNTGITIASNAPLLWGTGGAGGFTSPDVKLFRDAANTLALRNGANAQTLRAYNSFTDASNGSWGTINFADSANVFTIGTKSLGTGIGVPVKMQFVIEGVDKLDYGVTTAGVWTTIADLTVGSGKNFKVGNAATTGLTAGVLAALTNATIVISDSTGQAYRIPCII